MCRLCSQPLQAARTSGDFICLACRRAPKTVDRLLALWSYEEPVDAIIRALKFSGHIGLAAPLAGLMAERLREVGVIPDIIAPVPLHWTRRLTRGYDQSQEIARHLSRRLGVRLGQPLRRHRRTRAQSRLPRARRGGNLFRAFSANRRRDATGQRVLLVDDVVTSGATLRAAAARLRSMGAHSIVAVVVARTPEPGENILQPLAALRRF